jgi:hypothetical protein
MRASLRWNGTRDLDLAAYWRRGDDRGLVYYGDPGDLDGPPWVQLLGDDDGTDGENLEELVLGRADAVVWLLCWDSARVDAAEAGPLEADFEVDGQRVSVDGEGNLAVLGVVRDGEFTPRVQVHTITGLQHIDTLEALLA